MYSSTTAVPIISAEFQILVFALRNNVYVSGIVLVHGLETTGVDNSH